MTRMTFELSREHEEFRRTVREFAAEQIAPNAAQWDRDHHFPIDVVQQMGDLGLFGLTAPEDYGGAGLEGEDGGFTSLCLAIEEIGRADQSMGITLEAAVGLGINPILSYGSAAQKEQWLPDLVAGRTLAGFGLTEPGAGSDAGATRTKAELVGGEWVINGAKQFITNSGSELTSVVTVTARTGEAADTGRPEISAILVPSGTPGFTAEPAYDKLGWHASDTHPLTLSDVHVPEANLLGVVYSDPGAMTVAPYRVLKADHWIFEGTGLRDGDLFGLKTLHERYGDGASGHETDKVSASSPKGIEVLARGLNPDNGGADLVCFDTPAGGSVFSAGSITYPTALFTDEPTSQITLNVLRRFLA